MRHLPRVFRIKIIFAILAALTLTWVNVSHADERKANGVLDGMVFFGQIGEGGEQGYEDKLSFADGQFWPEICIRCGFKPGSYWTRNEPDGIHFRGELKGGFGEFVYEGRIIGGRAIVEVAWKKDRWYWTSGRKLLFEGSTIPGENPYSSNEAEQIAIEALLNDLPDFCW